MEPVPLIVAALTAGATAALQETAHGAIKAATRRPKALGQRRMTGDPAGEAALNEIERAPEADATAMKGRLAATAPRPTKSFCARPMSRSSASTPGARGAGSTT